MSSPALGDPGAFARFDRAVFFDRIRGLFRGGRLDQAQVEGIVRLLDAFLLYALLLDRRHLAYIFATSFHETGQRMQPVREGFAASDAQARAAVARLLKQGKISRNYALPNKRGLSFYGRGDVQLTHEANYAAMGALLGLDLAGQPDLALDPAVSARILIEGVTRGVSIRGDFTGRALEDYIRGEACDYVGARRTVNGTDRAGDIAKYARAFEAALTAAGMPRNGTRQPLAPAAPVTPPAPVAVVEPAPVLPPVPRPAQPVAVPAAQPGPLPTPSIWSRFVVALMRPWFG